MRILVTGSSGFIGSATARALVSRGHEVWGWSRRPTPPSVLPPERVILGDLVDDAAPRPLPRSLDVVVHCAAIATPGAALSDPSQAFRVNTLGTVSALEVARAAGARFLLTSSVYVYDSCPELPWHEELPLRPHSPLGASKLGAESAARAYASCYDVPVVIARLFTVFGPGAGERQFVPTAMRRIVEARDRVEFGSGDATRDFVYIDDVVDGLLACSDAFGRLPGFAVFNLAGGRERSIRECVASIAEIAGKPGLEIVFDRLSPRADERGANRHWASIEKAGREVGWRPRVAFEEGLRRTYHALHRPTNEEVAHGR